MSWDFISSPRGRLWVTFGENRDKAMPGVRGDSCHVCGATGHGEGPAWDPGCRGAVGLSPAAASSFPQLELVGAPNTSGKIRNRNISKERGLTAKLCRNQMSFFRAFTQETWVIAPLPRGEGASPSQKKAWLRTSFSRGFSGIHGYRSVQPLTGMWQWCATQPKIPGRFLWGRRPRTPQELPVVTAFPTSSEDVIALHQINWGSFFPRGWGLCAVKYLFLLHGSILHRLLRVGLAGDAQLWMELTGSGTRIMRTVVAKQNVLWELTLALWSF